MSDPLTVHRVAEQLRRWHDYTPIFPRWVEGRLRRKGLQRRLGISWQLEVYSTEWRIKPC